MINFNSIWVLFNLGFILYLNLANGQEYGANPRAMMSSMKVQLCFQGPCPEAVKRTFEVGPTLEQIPDTLQYLTSFQELILLNSDDKCPIEACACRQGQRACQPLINRLYENFLLVNPPGCAQSDPEVGKLLENLRNSAESKNARGVCSVLGTFRKMWEKPAGGSPCASDAVAAIKETFKMQAARLDFKSSCMELPC